MAKDEATEEVSVDEDIPVDDVLSDAQDTLEGIEGGGDDLDADLGDGAGGTDASTTDLDAGLDEGLGGSGRSTSAPDRESKSSGGSLLPSLSTPDSLSDLFSTKHFLGAGVLSAIGAIAGGLLIPIPILGSVIGLFVAGFLLGVVSGRSSYVEVGIATGVAGALIAALISIPLLALGGLGVPVFVVGAVSAILVGLMGHYFGRDLRSGLTRDVGGDDGPI